MIPALIIYLLIIYLLTSVAMMLVLTAPGVLMLNEIDIKWTALKRLLVFLLWPLIVVIAHCNFIRKP